MHLAIRKRRPPARTHRDSAVVAQSHELPHLCTRRRDGGTNAVGSPGLDQRERIAFTLDVIDRLAQIGHISVCEGKQIAVGRYLLLLN